MAKRKKKATRKVARRKATNPHISRCVRLAKQASCPTVAACKASCVDLAECGGIMRELADDKSSASGIRSAAARALTMVSRRASGRPECRAEWYD